MPLVVGRLVRVSVEKLLVQRPCLRFHLDRNVHWLEILHYKCLPPVVVFEVTVVQGVNQ